MTAVASIFWFASVLRRRCDVCVPCNRPPTPCSFRYGRKGKAERNTKQPTLSTCFLIALICKRNASSGHQSPARGDVFSTLEPQGSPPTDRHGQTRGFRFFLKACLVSNSYDASYSTLIYKLGCAYASQQSVATRWSVFDTGD